MLNLKFAQAYVEFSLERKRYDSDVLKLQRDLARFPGQVTVEFIAKTAKFRQQIHGLQKELAKFKTFTIELRVNRLRAVADLNLVRQQAEALQRRSFGTVAIRADLRPWRTAMRSVAFDLYRVRQFANIPIATSTGRAHANLNLLLQQLKVLQAASKLGITTGGVGRRGGGGGGGGGSSFGGGGFIAGLGQGLGLPFATSPQMMAGNLVGSGIRGSVGTTAGLQTQVAELRRVSGMSAAAAAAYKKSLFSMGTTQSGVSVDDLMEISQIGGRAGVAEREGPKGLETFTRDLAMVKNSVADMPTEELAESMVKVLNVFELGTDRVAGFGSALTAMDNVSVASARDILNITTRLSGTAQAIGMTLPQVTAFSSVLKDVGLTNEVAGTSFSQVFRKMATESHNFAEQIGVDAETFANAYRRDPMEALGMVIRRFNEMKDTIEGQEFLADLGLEGARVTGSLQQLASKFELVESRAKIASAETGSLNALMTANALKSDTLEASYQKLKNALVELADAMGQPLLGPATDTTRALTALTKAAVQGNPHLLLKSIDVAGLNPLAAMGIGVGHRDDQMRSLTDDMMQLLFPDVLANAAKPAGGGMPALPAKKPEIVGPPNVVRDPNAGANLLFQAGNRLSNFLAVVADTRNAMMGVGGRALGKVSESLVPKKEKQQTFASGLSGEEIGRRIQNDILNMTKDKSGEETAKNTKPLAGLLGEVRDILKAGGQGVGAAVLGQ